MVMAKSDDLIKVDYPYSIFWGLEQYCLMVTVSLIGCLSTMSSPIYFPALTDLSKSFHVESGIMNITLVAYLLFQGLIPSISATIADSYGRKPVLLISMLIFIAACIAISQTNAFWLLAVLRCFQAGGIAPVIAISSGIAGDVRPPATRGGFVGWVAGGQLIGNGFGSLIGAALIAHWHTWRAIFVFLSIIGGVAFVMAIFVLPETLRLIVGNGSIPPKKFFYKSIFLYLNYFKVKLTHDEDTKTKKQNLDFFSPFKMLFRKEIALTLIPSGLIFATWTMTLTTMGTELQSQYDYSIMHVGLIYLPQGIACLVSTVVSGRVLNIYYRYRRKKYNKMIEDCKLSGESPSDFNVIRSRLDITIIPSFGVIAGLLIFGWCIQYKKHVISIIISSCMISIAASAATTCTTTMLVDISPGKASAATACLNIVRCWLAAAGSGALDAMVDAMGIGGTYSLLAGLNLLCQTILIIFIIKCSHKLTFSTTQS